jgi:hypothetical protein
VKRFAKRMWVCVPAAAVMVGALVMGSGASAFAYGTADNPVAQVEISGNCTNASVCPTLFGGTGGVWIWAELDAAYPGATYGTSDYTFAGCGHTVGGIGGPGGAGGGGGPARDGTWHVVDSVFTAAGDGYFPVDVAIDKWGNPLNVPYYEISLPAGNPSQPFQVAVPVPRGHYSAPGLLFPNFTKIPGVNFQTQVAP